MRVFHSLVFDENLETPAELRVHVMIGLTELC